MHQYRIEVYEYDNGGNAASVPFITRYADNHEDARMICDEFANQLQENGYTKKYKVELYVLCYKNVNRVNFFAQFQA